jgi:hypothetical protein
MPHAGEIFGRGHAADSRGCRIVSRSGGCAGTDTRVRRHSAHHYCSMSRIPRVTSSDLLAALATAGFAVIRVKGATTSSATRMGGPPWCRRIRARRSVPDCCIKSFTTVNSRSRTFRSETAVAAISPQRRPAGTAPRSQHPSGSTKSAGSAGPGPTSPSAAPPPPTRARCAPACCRSAAGIASP